MAKAFGDLIGMTKRQVQSLTDAGVFHCLPETDRQGRGRQRLYGKDELPVAAVIAAVARYQIPVGTLIHLSNQIREMAYGPLDPAIANIIDPQRLHADFQSALRGDTETFALLFPRSDPTVPGEMKYSIGWGDESMVQNCIKDQPSVLVINVKSVVQRVV